MSDITPLSERERTAVLPSARFADATTLTIVIAIASAIVLRAALLFRYRIDSDETQHLHVVWGWTHGLLPYRDFFDNHMPLFHLLATPVLWLSGERPQALLIARFAMVPLFAVMALLTYRIGISCHTKRSALLAVVLGMLAPDFFLCSIEFRTDVLWATMWLASIAILVAAPLTPRRAAAAGLALGLAGAISAKSSLLAVSLAIAAIVTLLVTREDRMVPRAIAKCAAAFAAAAIAPVAIVAAYFFGRGAWKPFVYCVVTHNVVASEHPERLLLVPLSIAIIAVVARRIARDDVTIELRRRRLFIFLTASIYAAALVSFWPIIQTEHWLPFYPLIAVAIVPLLLPAGVREPPRLLFALLALELFWIVKASTPWRNRVVPTTTMIEQALTLTTPRESVVDLKGDLVFRPRAFYYVLEKLTKKAIARGRLRDTIAADVLRTGTMVAVSDNVSFPRDGRAFLDRNFIRVGCLRVAGMPLNGGRFRVEVPGEYAVVSDRGAFTGTLDGTPYASARPLAPGIHTIANAAAATRTALVWQRAAALGFSPFVTDSRCSGDAFAR